MCFAFSLPTKAISPPKRLNDISRKNPAASYLWPAQRFDFYVLYTSSAEALSLPKPASQACTQACMQQISGMCVVVTCNGTTNTAIEMRS